MESIETFFLCDECQPAESVAERLARFLRTATRTIDICAYSFSLCEEPRETILSALKECAQAGVKVRIAYDDGSQKEIVALVGNDFCDFTTPEFVRSLPFPSLAIGGSRALMHNKYIIVDAGTPNAQVWTGSTNLTLDGWSFQENNIITLRSRELARRYLHDFNELWVDASISGSRALNAKKIKLKYKGKPAYVAVHFSPIEGEWIDATIAQTVERTQERATLAAVVVTSGAILNALLNLMKRGVPLEGIYDGTQMRGVKRQWELVPANNWKIGAWERLVAYGGLVGKRTIPYAPGSKHDFMHNKIMVLDDLTVTGSYNFSRHAQRNAENLLMIESPPLAQEYRRYIAGLVQRYGA